MKRTDIKAKATELGIELSDEFVDYIMDSNGKDINNSRASADKKDSEIEALKNQIKELEDKNSSYKDYDDLKKTIEEYKTKEDSKRKANFLIENGCDSTMAELLVGKLDWSKGKIENDKYSGLDEEMDALKNQYSKAFEVAHEDDDVPPYYQSSDHSANDIGEMTLEELRNL